VIDAAADVAVRALSARPIAPMDAQRPPSAGGVPAQPGFYAWWARDGAMPSVPREPHPTAAEFSLLYVGIAPARESSSQLLRGRVVGNHLGGNTGSSTFRLTLASLLCEEQSWCPVPSATKALLADADNAALTQWQRDNLGVTWATRQRPWEIEHEVIARMKPPLNLAANAGHPFLATVRDARARFRAMARASTHTRRAGDAPRRHEAVPRSEALTVVGAASTGWPDEVTPKDIARVLSVSDKTLRQWLRGHPPFAHGLYQRWVFTPREADEIVVSYRASRRP
jgi:hypothetical protein